MLTYELFLSRSARSRLEFYQHFIDLPRRYQDVGQVARLRDTSPTSVYRTLTLITDDLGKLRQERGAEPVPSNAPFKDRFNIPASIYAVYLMRHSVSGALIQALMNHPEWTINDFSEATRLSKATIFRHIKALKDYLRTFDLRITLGPLGLQGKESTVRVALSELAWQLSQDGSELFPSLNGVHRRAATELRKAGLVLPNISDNRLACFCAVHIIRSRQGHELSWHQPLSTVLTATGFSKRHGQLPAFTDKYPAAIAIMHLQSVLTASYHDAADPLLVGFVGHHVRTNSPYWQLVQQIIHRMHSLAGVDPKQLDNQVLAANLLSITVALDLLGTNVPDFDPLVVATGAPAPDSLPKMLKQVFATLPSHLKSFTRIQSGLITRFLPLLTHVLPDAQARVRVAIDPQMEQSLYSAIKGSLERMPAVEIIDKPQYARLIVTSDMRRYKPINRKKRADQYYFALSSYSAWQTLEHLVHYLAIHECGLKTGSGIGYTQLDPGLISAEL